MLKVREKPRPGSFDRQSFSYEGGDHHFSSSSFDKLALKNQNRALREIIDLQMNLLLQSRSLALAGRAAKAVPPSRSVQELLLENEHLRRRLDSLVVEDSPAPANVLPSGPPQRPPHISIREKPGGGGGGGRRERSATIETRSVDDELILEEDEGSEILGPGQVGPEPSGGSSKWRGFFDLEKAIMLAGTGNTPRPGSGPLTSTRFDAVGARHSIISDAETLSSPRSDAEDGVSRTMSEYSETLEKNSSRPDPAARRQGDSPLPPGPPRVRGGHRRVDSLASEQQFPAVLDHSQSEDFDEALQPDGMEMTPPFGRNPNFRNARLSSDLSNTPNPNPRKTLYSFSVSSVDMGSEPLKGMLPTKFGLQAPKSPEAFGRAEPAKFPTSPRPGEKELENLREENKELIQGQTDTDKEINQLREINAKLVKNLSNVHRRANSMLSVTGLDAKTTELDMLVSELGEALKGLDETSSEDEGSEPKQELESTQLPLEEKASQLGGQAGKLTPTISSSIPHARHSTNDYPPSPHKRRAYDEYPPSPPPVVRPRDEKGGHTNTETKQPSAHHHGMSSPWSPPPVPQVRSLQSNLSSSPRGDPTHVGGDHKADSEPETGTCFWSCRPKAKKRRRQLSAHRKPQKIVLSEGHFTYDLDTSGGRFASAPAAQVGQYHDDILGGTKSRPTRRRKKKPPPDLPRKSPATPVDWS